jgi:hypothetical protein
MGARWTAHDPRYYLEVLKVEGKLEAARSVVEGALDELALLSGVEG